MTRSWRSEKQSSSEWSAGILPALSAQREQFAALAQEHERFGGCADGTSALPAKRFE